MLKFFLGSRSRTILSSPILSHMIAAVAGAGLHMALSASDVWDVRPLREFMTVARVSGTKTTNLALNPSGLAITAVLLTVVLLAIIYCVAKFAPSTARLAALRFIPREEAAHAGETIKSEIRRILANVRRFGQANERYTRALALGSSRLSSADRPELMRTIVTSLVEENEAMRQQSAELKSQLYDTERRLRDVRTDIMRADQLARSDALTGVGNRRSFNTSLMRETANAASEGYALSLVMCDVDQFQSINGTHGQQVGDEVLKLFAGLLRRACRADHIVSRFDQEEFAVIMPRTTSSEASSIANTLRRQLGEQSFMIYATGEKLPPLTASFGVAQLQSGEHEDAFVMRADRILYLAKTSGRNQVMVSPD